MHPHEREPERRFIQEPGTPKTVADVRWKQDLCDCFVSWGHQLFLSLVAAFTQIN